MPADIPPPDECDDASVFIERYFNNPQALSAEGRLALEAYRKVLDFPTTFDIKIVNARKNIQVDIGGPLKSQVWIKARQLLGPNASLHHCVAAFISDITPIGTPIGAHAGTGFQLGMAASLDHSMWLHRPDRLRMDEWVFYETISTAAAGARALIHGQMWSRDGLLLLSTSQEILVRAQR
jgi:acyl-CoA thioesterase-2